MNPMLLQLLTRYGPRAAGFMGLGTRHGMINMFGPGASRGVPTMASQNNPTPMDTPPALAPQAAGASQVATPPQPASAPMPQARPAEAPAAPEMSWFQRNAAMMRDPSSGAFIDPTSAERAQQQMASGPDVVSKLLDMFHKKDT